MTHLESYEDDIYKCSRCGLCQSACPIYEITGNETNVSRGFFSLLSGILKGDLKYNKKIRLNLDKCLSCNACKDFCPSGIDPEKIMTAAKIETFKYANPIKKLALKVVYSKKFLKLASLVKLYRLFPILNFCHFGKILHAFLKPNVKYKKIKSEIQENLNVAIFPGCINNYFNSSTLNAMRMILEKHGINYTMPKEFECCTMPAYNIGDMENFKKFAQINLDAVPDNIDYLLFDCASCQKAFKLYGEILNTEKAKSVAKKSLHINEFLIKQKIKLLPNSNIKATYHKPCHLACLDETYDLIEKLDIKLKPLDNFKKCCGMAGLFSVDNFKISNQLAKEKAQNMLKKSNLALTDCPLCRLGILKGAILNNQKIDVKTPIEILSDRIFKKTM